MSAAALKRPVESAISRRQRSKRWHRFHRRFPDLADMSVLDLGGTLRSWELALVQPAHLLLVNYPGMNPPGSENIVEGDACDPDLLSGEHFDLIYSNSVIEHVGGHWRRERFADTIHRLADHHWVQTPYRYFPIEPHWLMPGMQFLPTPLQARASHLWPLGNYSHRKRSHAENVSRVQRVELLTRTQMRHYFPESELMVEHFSGLPKSLIAVG